MLNRSVFSVPRKCSKQQAIIIIFPTLTYCRDHVDKYQIDFPLSGRDHENIYIYNHIQDGPIRLL